MDQLLFLAGVAFLTAHELDAIRQHEWRVFPITRALDEESGYRLFVILHIPLWMLIFWFMGAPTFQLGFDVFLIAHGAAHSLLRRHPLVTFDGPLSRLLIYGAALGAAHLWLLL